MLWNFKSCRKCGGDLVSEEADEWRCVQCGRYYYPSIEQSLDLETAQSRRGIPGDGVAAGNTGTLASAVDV